MNGKTKWVLAAIGAGVTIILSVAAYVHALDREVNTCTTNITVLQKAEILAAQERKDSAKELAQIVVPHLSHLVWRAMPSVASFVPISPEIRFFFLLF